jgi:hypothetical protein
VNLNNAAKATRDVNRQLSQEWASNHERESPSDASSNTSREGSTRRTSVAVKGLNRRDIQVPVWSNWFFSILRCLEPSFWTPLVGISTPHRGVPAGSYQVSRRKRLALEVTHKLCPIGEIETTVPLGIASSLYTFPETPTIGLESWMTSSSEATRATSTMTGWILNVSYVTTSQNCSLGSHRGHD